MWSSTNQRIKALISARLREKERLMRPIHVLRADVTLSIASEDSKIEVPARALLNDFTSDGICLYTNRSLPPNMEMVLDLHHPEEFSLQCRVVWCQYQSSASRVLTAQSYSYRVGLAFRFSDQAQTDQFKSFCERMTTVYAYNGAVELHAVAPESGTAVNSVPVGADESIASADAATNDGEVKDPSHPADALLAALDTAVDEKKAA